MATIAEEMAVEKEKKLFSKRGETWRSYYLSYDLASMKNRVGTTSLHFIRSEWLIVELLTGWSQIAVH